MMRCSGALRNLVVAAALLLWLTPAPVSAQQWIDGALTNTTHNNCLYGYSELLTGQYVGYWGVPDLSYPLVGDVYYGHVFVMTVGNACAGVYVRPEITLPPNTTLAISSQNPVQCWFNGERIEAQHCLQAPTPGLYGGTYSFLSTPDGGAWPLAAGATLEIQFPMVSSQPMSGTATSSFLRAFVKVIDGGGNPLGTPTQGVVVGGAAASRPGAFSKSTPANGAAGLSTSPDVSWGASSGATGYEYCVSPASGSCSSWTPTGPVRWANKSGLSPGTPYLWQVRATNAAGTTYGNANTVWSFRTAPRARPDLDGDRKADLAVWRPGDGQWYWVKSSDSYGSATYRAVQWGSQALNDRLVPGDYDGDGKTDLAIWRPGDGKWYWRTSTSDFASYRAVQWGSHAANDVLVPGDYDGDGKTDLAVWRPGDGKWYWLKSSDNYGTASYQAVQWGTASDVPIPADYDGDGKTDLCVWRPSDGTWYWLKSSDNYNKASYGHVQWGSQALNDQLVPGDYDGDGKADLAIWRPGDGTWYWRTSSSGFASYRAIQWGSQTVNDRVVPADYDGDGKTDLAIWRPGEGRWYWLRSTDSYAVGSYGSRQWGSQAVGDVPVREK